MKIHTFRKQTDFINSDMSNFYLTILKGLTLTKPNALVYVFPVSF